MHIAWRGEKNKIHDTQKKIYERERERTSLHRNLPEHRWQLPIYDSYHHEHYWQQINWPKLGCLLPRCLPIKNTYPITFSFLKMNRVNWHQVLLSFHVCRLLIPAFQSRFFQLLDKIDFMAVNWRAEKWGTLFWAKVKINLALPMFPFFCRPSSNV